MTRSVRSGAPRPRRHEGASAPISSKGGRPTSLQSEQLRGRILDAATSLFLTHGYGATSIDAVARSARISKRTFYHRFDDKADLFGAVVHRIVDRLRPPASVALIEGADLEEILERLAGLILRASLSEQAVALHRLIVAESVRFPQLAAVVARQGALEEAIALIAGLLHRQSRKGKLTVPDASFAAGQFLYMVISLPQRRAMGMGAPMTTAELRKWPRDVVSLFLNGFRRGATRRVSAAR